jgi:hypothetical protein
VLGVFQKVTVYDYVMVAEARTWRSIFRNAERTDLEELAKEKAVKK